MQTKSSEKNDLLSVLHQMAPDSSKNTLRSWIKEGRVSHNGKLAQRANQIVDQGDEVSISAKAKFLKGGMKILFEDEDMVVIFKPAGLLSVATRLETEHTAHAYLKRRFHRPKVYPVHRLDRETSGLLVFAYTEKARDHLKKQLEERTLHREYEALVHGHPGEGVWKGYLREDKSMRVHPCSAKEGKEAITYFETIKRQGSHSLLKLRLKTGRKHQIRVQASSAGHPIVGDQKYGLEEDKKKGLKLKAVALRLDHPITGKSMNFTNQP